MSITLDSRASIAETDAALTAALAGDRQAFRRIVERYQNLVCAIAYSALGDVGGSHCSSAGHSFLSRFVRQR